VSMKNTKKSQRQRGGRTARLRDGRAWLREQGGGADHFMDRLEEWLRANKVLASK
jgi:hypothetical protein